MECGYSRNLGTEARSLSGFKTIFFQNNLQNRNRTGKLFSCICCIFLKYFYLSFVPFNLYLIWFDVWFQQPPFVYKNAAGEWEGYCIDLLKSLQTLIDFEYELYEAPDKEYGRINDDMEWNGAVKEIIDEVQHVNIILVAIENTSDKYNTMIKYIY